MAKKKSFLEKYLDIAKRETTRQRREAEEAERFDKEMRTISQILPLLAMPQEAITEPEPFEGFLGMAPPSLMGKGYPEGGVPIGYETGVGSLSTAAGFIGGQTGAYLGLGALGLGIGGLIGFGKKKTPALHGEWHITPDYEIISEKPIHGYKATAPENEEMIKYIKSLLVPYMISGVKPEKTIDLGFNKPLEYWEEFIQHDVPILINRGFLEGD